VKPGNVLFANSTAKVMDFGLAVFEQAASGASGSAWGSPVNMAPERLEGLAEDFRSDIYSLGTVLYQMLTGRPVFDAPSPQEVALKRLTHPAPSVLTFAQKTSNATAFIVKKLLEKDRDLRFSSYAELIQSLQYARAELGQKGQVKAARVVLDAPDQRKAGMWMTLAFAVFVLVAAIVGVVMVRKSRQRDVVSEIPEVSSPSKKSSVPAPIASSSSSPAAPAPASTATHQPINGPGQVASIAPGLYKLKNRANGQLLDVSGWNSNSDANINTWPGGSGLNQRWIVRPANNGVHIIALHSCKALAVSNGSSDDSALIRHTAISTIPQQVWRFEVADEGNYRIISTVSGKALTVLNTSAASGSSVGQRAASTDPAQQWKLEPLGGWPSELNPILDRAPLGAAPSPVTAKLTTEPKNSKFVPISLEGVMNCDSRKGNFDNEKNNREAVHPTVTGWVEVGPATFQILDVNTTPKGKDVLVLKGGLSQARNFTKRVEIPVNGAPLTKLHFLSGVGAWAFPWDRNDNHLGVLAGQVTVVRKGGAQQIIQFRNGIEFADYFERNDVPGSAYVQGLADYGRQVRYFSKSLFGSDPVEKIIIESFETNVAPIFLAVTGEK
jgi:serine/threonine protein kinase